MRRYICYLWNGGIARDFYGHFLCLFLLYRVVAMYYKQNYGQFTWGSSSTIAAKDGQFIGVKIPRWFGNLIKGGCISLMLQVAA